MDSTSPNADFSNRPSSLDVLIIWETHEFHFHVFVTNDCTDIRGIMTDDDSIDAIQNLTSEMKLYYNIEESEAFSVVEGEYYAVFDDEWHRVQCTSYDSKKQLATVLFIDRGDEDDFTLDNLHLLPSKFRDLPAQHFKLSLNDLEIFRYCEEIQDILDDLLHDKDVYVRVVKFQQDKSVTSLLAEMILDKDTEKEVNINEFLLEKVFELVVDPKIFIGIDKVAQQAHISFVSQEQIYMQIELKGLVYLHALMNDLTNNYLNNSDYKHKLVSKFDLTKLYVTKSPRDNNWYRVKVIEIKNEFEALVKFVDIGDTLLVRRRNLILLENLSKLLALYPEQAVEVKLHKISPFLFDEKLANKLRKLALPADILYTKVVGELNGIPIVQFCKRTENNYLISINDALVIEPPTMYLEDKTVSVVDTFNSRFSFPLKTPYIPAIDSSFDVFVTMVAHPEDFTVQPLCSRYKFKQMMADLLDVCESFSGPHLTPNCVKVGYLYAALEEEDDSWYRAYVYKIISKTQFGVYACDYGDYRIVTLKNMQPLQEGFCDLPYQAIKAKLVGISSDVKNNWTDNDTLRFMALIQSKNLVAIVKNLEINTAVVKGIVLSVDLVDTSEDEDIDMADFFNKKKEI
ncbi:tudor domain-containing protein 7-like [Nasonia vitripennis]|uniref:Tudor domain-containing protein n=1 Tax=Nasonia vitripennis TaxID=7425 RepID=A0A7M7H905_NASVI|nr:tudor domain-containing protein 7-like [Nasonia vitripennis]